MLVLLVGIVLIISYELPSELYFIWFALICYYVLITPPSMGFFYKILLSSYFAPYLSILTSPMLSFELGD